MNEDQFNAIMGKLDFIAKALLLNLVREMDFKEKVITLDKMGMKESDIVELLNEKRGRVNSVLRKAK